MFGFFQEKDPHLTEQYGLNICGIQHMLTNEDYYIVHFLIIIDAFSFHQFYMQSSFTCLAHHF